MLDKALSTIASSNQPDSYYFQLYPLTLSIIDPHSEVPAPGTTYRFTILKGSQKFDQSKLPIEANYKLLQGLHRMLMPKCTLNFYIPNHIKGRNPQFTVQMFQTENSTEYFIAEHLIHVEPYIDQYKNNRTVRFQHTIKFSEDYELEFQVYIEKSRFALEKVVKDYKVQRNLKSPLRERKEGATVSQTRKLSPNSKRALTGKDLSQHSQPNPSEKSQRQEVTQMSNSRNKKIQQEEPSQKEPSVQDSVHSELKTNTAAKTQKLTSRTAENQPGEEEPIPVNNSRTHPSNFNKKTNENKISAKTPQFSSSQNQVPVLQVRFKPVAKGDVPSQVRMTSSQRLGSSIASEIVSESPKAVSNSDTKEKVLLSIFLLVSIVLMYYAMVPNKRT